MLKISTYNHRVELIDIEFRFLRFAIVEISQNRKKEFFTTIKNEHIQNYIVGLGLAQTHLPQLFPKEEYSDNVESRKRNMQKKFAPRNRRLYEETIEDGLNASELLVRIALFESFMKDIHITILRARPSLLGRIRPMREVKYKDFFTEQSDYERILNQEINREVEEVDRMKFYDKPDYFDKTRAYYFAGNLKIPVGSENSVADQRG